MKLLEHLHGTGIVTVENEGEVAANYDIRITQEEPEAERGTPPLTVFKHLSGRVWSEHDPSFVLGHFRKTMTLQMEDGRKFKFFHKDSDGKIGLKKWIG